MPHNLGSLVVLIRGGGEVASAVAYELARSHFKICLTEIAQPLAVSRMIAFSEVVYDGEKEIEGIAISILAEIIKVRHSPS